MINEKLRVLKEYYGYDGFREGQEAVIDAILDEGKDALAVMPTGSGKSVCFQVPAMLLPGVTLVISPLISLMKDQVNALTRMGIPAAFINSSLTYEQSKRALSCAKNGHYKLIYVAPERIFSSSFLNFAKNTNISLIAVDEAHCVSQWGHDFRDSYLRIDEFIDQLKVRPVVTAFTATATVRVREDIKKLLNLRNPFLMTTGFDRENLFFAVRDSKNKFEDLMDELSSMKGMSGIIYCSTRETVESLTVDLTAASYGATRYHAGLSDVERRKNQEAFLIDEKPIMVATNAFGMGIDKSNVSFVIHYNMPKDIESYYQEAGRAGRDGKEARCVLFYNSQDIVLNNFFIESSHRDNKLPDKDMSDRVYNAAKDRLAAMARYAKSGTCLRQRILTYFGDMLSTPCTGCSVCDGDYTTVDITLEAQKILSCVKRSGERYGFETLVRLLHGDIDARIISAGLNTIKTFGIMNELKITKIRRLLDSLLSNDYLSRTEDEYHVLKLNESSIKVLKSEERVFVRSSSVEEKRTKKGKRIATNDVPAFSDYNMPKGKYETIGRPKKSLKDSAGTGGISPKRNAELFAKLKRLREKIANEEGVPAYVVFSNSTLIDMSEKMPKSSAEMLNISGIGLIKYGRYGERFLASILEYLDYLNNISLNNKIN
ncbi:MAG: DNA helicase RecQ [Clostridia bacterium]